MPLPFIAAIISAAGTIYSAHSQNQAAKYNAKVAENQAKQQDLEAREAIKRKRKENEAFLSRQRALRAKSGVSVESGSSLLVEAESAMRLELDALDFARQAESRRISLLQNAKLMRRQGRASLIGGFIQGAGTIASAMPSPAETSISGTPRGDAIVNSGIQPASVLSIPRIS